MDRLHGIIQNYAWGSISAIPNLRGVEPCGQPEAEMWFGAHLAAPSTLDDSTTLLARIEASPEAQLGTTVVDTFGPRLPFLLKLLAADQPLSIQAHPSAEQARDGYADEEARGIPLGAFERSFGDQHHKPELVVALSTFEALVGFRDFTSTAALFRSLKMPVYLIDLLDGDDPITAVREVLSPASEEARRAQEKAIDKISSLSASLHVSDDDRWSPEEAMLGRLATVHKDDPGLVVAAMLNRVALAPGEGLYLDAGIMHAYISGLSVEIMANSNNVVRGGLTQKHVDVSTLLDIVIPDPVTPRPVSITNGIYETPASEFSLARVQAGTSIEVAGPAVVLAISTSSVAGDSQTLVLEPTEAAWVKAGEMVAVQTNELAFVARVGA